MRPLCGKRGYSAVWLVNPGTAPQPVHEDKASDNEAEQRQAWRVRGWIDEAMSNEKHEVQCQIDERERTITALARVGAKTEAIAPALMIAFDVARIGSMPPVTE